MRHWSETVSAILSFQHGQPTERDQTCSRVEKELASKVDEVVKGSTMPHWETGPWSRLLLLERGVDVCGCRLLQACRRTSFVGCPSFLVRIGAALARVLSVSGMR